MTRPVCGESFRNPHWMSPLGKEPWIAGVMFGIDRVASEHWKTSALRDATTALVRDGLAMIAGDYRALLRHRRQP